MVTSRKFTKTPWSTACGNAASRSVNSIPLSVFDEDGTLLGEFHADLFVEDQLIVELKAVRAILDEHVAQLLGYLRSARCEHGLLMNFGAGKFAIRKYALSNPEALEL